MMRRSRNELARFRAREAANALGTMVGKKRVAYLVVGPPILDHVAFARPHHAEIVVVFTAALRRGRGA